MSTAHNHDRIELDRGQHADPSATDQDLPTVDRQRLQQVYQERARQFAARTAVAVKPKDTRPVLTFMVGSERLGIELSAVVEVLRCEHCTPIPGARPELAGVVNLRGRICSVIDLGLLLEFARSADTLRGCIVLVRQGGLEVGLRVDEVDQIEPVLMAELVLPGDTLPTKYVRGRTAAGLAVLDLRAVLSHSVFQGSRPLGTLTTTNVTADERLPLGTPAHTLGRSLTEGASV